MASYAAMAGGMGLGAFGALVQGQQTSDVLQYQATIQSRNAAEARASAQYNADRQSVIASRVIGAESTGFGASGVEASSGSVLSVIGASTANAELDRLNILHGGEMRAVNYENQASLDQLGARHAIQASYFDAISSLVGGGSEMLSYNYGGGSGAPSVNGGAQALGQVSTGESVMYDNTLYDNGFGWYPDSGPNGNPGFFGRGPRGSYA